MVAHQANALAVSTIGACHELARVGILDDICRCPAGNDQIMERLIAGVDQLMGRLSTSSGGTKYIPHRDPITHLAKPVVTLPLQNDKNFIFHVVIMERTARLPRWYLIVGNAQCRQAEQRAKPEVRSPEKITLLPSVRRQP
nr:hypothetical protein [Kushneria avicenniae]